MLVYVDMDVYIDPRSLVPEVEDEEEMEDLSDLSDPYLQALRKEEESGYPLHAPQILR